MYGRTGGRTRAGERLVSCPDPGAGTPELQITSTNYIAIDAETGEIYAQRGAHEHRAEASMTKVFTAIETIEVPPAGRAVTPANRTS